MTLITSTGFLNPEGLVATQVMREQVKRILATQTEETHLRTLGCALKALVSDEISAALVKVRNTK
jgi:hypothetical protein